MRLVLFLGSIGWLACAPAHVEPTPMPVANPVPMAAPAAESTPPNHAIDFETEVRPIFEARCSPCHVEGGKMYAKLPFDDPLTIRLLGEKLFTRLQNEEDQAPVRTFLASPKPPE